MTLWVFWPALGGDWLWDDDIYVTQNPYLRDFAGLEQIWFAPGVVDNYFPITFSAHWLEWHLWHDQTLGYHLTNVFLHIASALLVWRLFDKLGLRFGWLGGLIFAVHPAQVESVAWIAELKNALCLPPFLLALGAWLDFDASRKPRDYGLALGFFLVAMLCKTTVIMFPVVILLHAWWKRGRLRLPDLRASVPFFAVSLALGLMTLLAESRFQENRHVVMGDASARFVGAGLDYAFYIARFLVPVHLIPVYPQWTIDASSPVQYLPWLVLAGAAGWLATRRSAWARGLLLGLGYFFIFLLPFVGFIPTGFLAFTWVMDHFLYFPILGLIGLVLAAISTIERRLPLERRVILVAPVTTWIVLLAFLAHGYAAAFSSEEALWGYAVERSPSTWLAQANLGRAYLAAGRPADALAPMAAAVRLNPGEPGVHLNLGSILLQLGRAPDGEKELAVAAALDPQNPEIRNQDGIALAQMGRLPEALAQFERATKLDPGYALAHNDWGIALARNGRLEDAARQFEAALQIDPTLVATRLNLARALAQTGHEPEAQAQYRKVLEIDPGNAAAEMGLRQPDAESMPGRNPK